MAFNSSHLSDSCPSHQRVTYPLNCEFPTGKHEKLLGLVTEGGAAISGPRDKETTTQRVFEFEIFVISTAGPTQECFFGAKDFLKH